MGYIEMRETFSKIIALQVGRANLGLACVLARFIISVCSTFGACKLRRARLASRVEEGYIVGGSVGD